MNMTKAEVIKKLDAAIKLLQYIISHARYDRVDISQVLSTISPLESVFASNLLFQEVLPVLKCGNVSVPEAKELVTQLNKLKQDTEVERILVIGNGFDLAHNLPTRYDQFLGFCDTIHGKNDEASIYCREIAKLIYPNVWYDYFHDIIKHRLSESRTWIDFESEIADQVKQTEEYIKGLEKHWKSYAIDSSLHKPSLLSKSMPDGMPNEQQIENFISLMYSDLNRITRALEIYLAVFVQRIPVLNRVQDLLPYHYDYILSFNYTNTFDTFYSAQRFSDSVICYVHGKADKSHNTSNCNLVLGIDEYLDKGQKDKQLAFLQFKKYFQRIYKNTDKRYIQWLEVIPSGRRYEVHFFGHSLDVTDKDILRKLILHSNVQTKVFYYRKDKDDKSELSKKLHNLVKVIGSDELIERTSGGSKNTIEFIPQIIPPKQTPENSSVSSEE